jgi:hypothetical protein
MRSRSVSNLSGKSLRMGTRKPHPAYNNCSPTSEDPEQARFREFA